MAFNKPWKCLLGQEITPIYDYWALISPLVLIGPKIDPIFHYWAKIDPIFYYWADFLLIGLNIGPISSFYTSFYFFIVFCFSVLPRFFFLLSSTGSPCERSFKKGGSFGVDFEDNFTDSQNDGDCGSFRLRFRRFPQKFPGFSACSPPSIDSWSFLVFFVWTGLWRWRRFRGN